MICKINITRLLCKSILNDEIKVYSGSFSNVSGTRGYLKYQDMFVWRLQQYVEV